MSEWFISRNPTFSTAFPSSCITVVKPNFILLSSEFDSYTPQCLFNSLTTTMRLSKRQLSLPLSLCFSTFSPRSRFHHFPGKYPAPRREFLHTTGSSSLFLLLHRFACFS
ncbi:hypothetical protein AtNW77_Chr1g0076951 [Arabidopsis thaliana]